MFAKSRLLSIVCLEVRKVSIIQSSEVSAIQGILKYWKDSWDFHKRLLYSRCQRDVQ